LSFRGEESSQNFRLGSLWEECNREREMKPPMPEGVRPIDADLGEAFRDAVSCYFVSWSPALYGREISFKGRPFTIDAIFRLVMSFEDRLPDDLFDHLLDIGDVREDGLRADFAHERTYHAGAKYMLAVAMVPGKRYSAQSSALTCGSSARRSAACLLASCRRSSSVLRRLKHMSGSSWNFSRGQCLDGRENRKNSSI
jgi:hypothetical protein